MSPPGSSSCIFLTTPGRVTRAMASKRGGSPWARAPSGQNSAERAKGSRGLPLVRRCPSKARNCTMRRARAPSGKRRARAPSGKNGGERGIRTPDRGLAYTRFPSVRLQPLGHLSARVPHKFLPRTSPRGLGRSHFYVLRGGIEVAEGKGFEPPIPFQVLQFSRLAPSTTRPPFRLARP